VADPFESYQWHLPLVQAPAAWVRTEGAASVVVAVIEVGGFEYTHPDLANNLWANAADPVGGGDNDGNGYEDDVHGWEFDATECPNPGVQPKGKHPGHGTAVAGLVAAERNGAGVAGLCPKCRLMLLCGGQTVANYGSAFDYAVAMKASVINNSWGLTVPSTDVDTRITAAAIDGREGKGMVIVFALDDVPSEYQEKNQCTVEPATGSHPLVIAVGASNNGDARSFLSPIGDCLDLLAPGVALGTGNGNARYGITSTDLSNAPGYNTEHPYPYPTEKCPYLSSELTDRSYTRCFGGTSASAPQVAGVAGLMLSLDPELTRVDVEAILQDAADKIDAGAAMYDPMTKRSFTHGFGRLPRSDGG
jgi:subtilisin family serine protease